MANKKTEPPTNTKPQATPAKQSRPPAKKTQEVGTVWNVTGDVTRPDELVCKVDGGHVLDVPGVYTCGKTEITAK